MSPDGRMSVPRLPVGKLLAAGRLADASTPLLIWPKAAR
jgi:hypothetical protein